MSRSIHWHTAHHNIPAKEVTLFPNREAAEQHASTLRAYFSYGQRPPTAADESLTPWVCRPKAKTSCPHSVRIIPRRIRVAGLGLEVFAVVVSTKEMTANPNPSPTL